VPASQAGMLTVFPRRSSAFDLLTIKQCRRARFEADDTVPAEGCHCQARTLRSHEQYLASNGSRLALEDRQVVKVLGKVPKISE
jgi:hypothetical protein